MRSKRLGAAMGAALFAASRVSVASGLVTPVPRQIIEGSTNLGVLMYDTGLAPGAKLSVDLSSGLSEHCAVLVVLSSEQHQQWHQMFQMPDSDAIDGYRVSHWRHPFCSKLKVETVIQAAQPDEYYVGVLNLYGESFWIEGTLTYVNPGGQHLPLEAVHLPEALWFLSMSFLALMGVVAVLLLFVYARRSTLIHWLLVFCLWLKAVSLGLEWSYYDMLSRDGSAPLWRYQYWDFVTRFHKICEMLLLLIVALGLSLLRPRLTVNEMRCIVVMVLLSALTLAGLDAFCENTMSGPAGVEFERFMLGFFVVQVVFLCVIFVAIQFNLEVIAIKLQNICLTTRSAAVLYEILSTYRRFRRIFFSVVLKPVVILWLSVFVIADGEQWITEALDQTASWLIYAALFFVLRPGCAQSNRGEQGVLDLVRVADAAFPPGQVSLHEVASLVSPQRGRERSDNGSIGYVPLPDGPDP